MNQDQFIHYLLGFADGEGCFCIALKKQKSAKMRWVLDPVFHITQHVRSKKILQDLQKKIGMHLILENLQEKLGRESMIICSSLEPMLGEMFYLQ